MLHLLMHLLLLGLVDMLHLLGNVCLLLCLLVCMLQRLLLHPLLVPLQSLHQVLVQCRVGLFLPFKLVCEECAFGGTYRFCTWAASPFPGTLVGEEEQGMALEEQGTGFGVDPRSCGPTGLG